MSSDITVQNASNLGDFRPQPRIAPTYLILLEDPTASKKVRSFIATKLEDIHVTAKMIGFDVNESGDTIIANFADIMKDLDRAKQVEIIVPSSRIIRIQNLSFRPRT